MWVMTINIMLFLLLLLYIIIIIIIIIIMVALVWFSGLPMLGVLNIRNTNPS